MAQPVETATDHRHTHKDLGLIMVVGQMVRTGELGQTNTQTNKQTLPNALSPLLRGR